MRIFVMVMACASLAIAACDTPAQPSAAVAGPNADPERLSREHESCGATLHCAEGLRCFAEACARTNRSTVGDYGAALGDRLREGGDLPGALAAYADALKRYDAEKLEVPVDLECGYGSALAASRTNKEHAELAARVLHRCINGSPAGSPGRKQALREMAALGEVGLDPAHLSTTEPADVYLSGAPAQPRTDALAVTVAASPEPRKGWPEIKAELEAGRAGLVACWEAHFGATKQAVMTVAVPIKSTYKDSGYDDEPGYHASAVDPKAAPPASAAEGCVRDAVGAVFKTAKGELSTTVTVTVK